MEKDEAITKLGELKLRTILICGFRYALGRKTYISAEVVDCLIDVWSFFTASDRQLFKREIEAAIDDDLAGDACDVEQWRRILEMPDE